MPKKTRASLFLQTTEVPAAKSIGEITGELSKAGATAIMQTFGGGKVTGVRWSMNLYNQECWFELPVRIEPVFQKLYERKSTNVDTTRLREMAERVAWRQLLMWVKVQMAMIDINLVEFAQVFLPYHTETQHGASVWEHFKGQKFKALPPPS
jgi:hypothetical protein